MNARMLSLAASLAAAGEPFAVATVVRREAPSSARLGDTAIITRDGNLRGFIGGSCTRSTVVHQALRVLADNEARLISFRDEDPPRADDIVGVPTTCHSGGSVEIYIDPVFPAPRLVLLGSSPINQALAGLGSAMGYTVQAIEGSNAERRANTDRGSDTDRGSNADEERAGGGNLAIDNLPKLADREPGVRLFALVATMGESDEDMLEAALAARPDYLGVIASRRRMEEIRATLRQRGVADDHIDAIDGPAGLDIGATRPEEIAVSILAKIVAVRRAAARSTGAYGGSKRVPERHAAAPSATAPAAAAATASAPAAATTASAPATATDPVCGMAVATDGSKPVAEHDGRTYHFCCSGCRDRFVEDPKTYLAAAGIETTGGDREAT